MFYRLASPTPRIPGNPGGRSLSGAKSSKAAKRTGVLHPIAARPGPDRKVIGDSEPAKPTVLSGSQELEGSAKVSNGDQPARVLTPAFGIRFDAGNRPVRNGSVGLCRAAIGTEPSP